MVRRANVVRAAIVALACLGLAVLWSAEAQGALVKVGNLVLRAGGSFHPQRLPRNRYAPIEFQGHADIRNAAGGLPPELTEATLEFDHDGRIQTRGLPVCPARRIAKLRTPAARRRCKGAIVGEGTIGAILFVGGAAFPAHAPLTLFNGPPSGRDLTVNAHVHVASPINQTFVVPVTIASVRGEYRYRASFDIPSLSGGGVLTHVDAKIGRRYTYKGRQRSYVSARCRDGIFRTHGHFLFDDGTVIDGAVENACVPENF
jgi:hypothetical protein